MPADAKAWEAYRRLKKMSEPAPFNLSKGHELHMAEWKETDGGVVVYRYHPFCRCGWASRFPTYRRELAIAAFARHQANPGGTS